jgi:hypothetical protein
MRRMPSDHHRIVKEGAVGHRVRALGIMLAVLAGAAPLAAQTRVDIGGFGGLSLPTNEAADLYNAGYTLGGTFRYHPEEWPLGLQFDGQYMTHVRDDRNQFDGGLDMYGGSVSAVFSLYPEVSSIVPYLLVGGGLFNLTAQNARQLPDSLVYGSQTKPAIVFGGGFEYRTWTSRLIPYIDLRMIGLFGSDPREGAYITITGGLKYVLGGKRPR